MSDDLESLITEVRARVGALGYELADLRRGGSRTRVLLQVRIDRPDAPGGIKVEDCATVSRALEEWLDVAGVLGANYVLEVSSPGIERPVRWREHWERFAGRDVHVRLRGRGRVRATIVRVEQGEGTDAVVLRPRGDIADLTVPLLEARDATLAVDWT
jgi:ribosome maturation factor RimP